VYPWGKLERLIRRLNRLPQSAYRIAVAEDDEAAEAALARADKSTGATSARRRPTLEEWSPEVEYIAGAVDRLGELIATVIATTPGAKKPPRIRPLLRPQTALERVQTRQTWQQHHDLVAEVEAAQERWIATRQHK